MHKIPVRASCLVSFSIDLLVSLHFKTHRSAAVKGSAMTGQSKEMVTVYPWPTFVSLN